MKWLILVGLLLVGCENLSQTGICDAVETECMTEYQEDVNYENCRTTCY